MLANLFTKKNLPSILTITLLILTVGFLFLYGNSKIKKAENINSTVLAWENLSTDYHPLHKGGHPSLHEGMDGRFSKNLNITIQNITSKKVTYKVDWLLNEKTIDSQEVEISAQNKKIIPPTKKVMDELAALLETTPEDESSVNKTSNNTLYQVKITWNTTPKADQRTGKHKTETLGKWF